MTVEDGYKKLLHQLHQVYDEREAANIADLVMEQITGWKKIERFLNKKKLLTAVQQESLDESTRQLLQNKPVQYVLGEAWFAGMKFFVDENVLIPRPETEELVEWIKEDIKNNKPAITIDSILDIGTGSGCISIALKKHLKNISVTSLEVSEGALKLAQKNADLQGTNIHFLLFDFLKRQKWEELALFDIIVSNPPYIKESERLSMNKNVLDYEPSLALFVPDNDALLFYRKIVDFGKQHLTANGKIYVEINGALGKEVSSLFRKEGYQVELRKDMQGKDRMMKAILL